MWSGDRLIDSEVESLLGECDLVVPGYFSDPLKYSRVKIETCLSRGVPVLYSTKWAIPDDLVDKLSKVPRSALQLSIEFPGLSNQKRDFLGVAKGLEPSVILPTMHAAKAKKISQILELWWHPHIVHKFDLFETVDTYKNYVSHVALCFPEISDALVHQEMPKWKEVNPDAEELFGRYFEPNVPARTWVLKDRYQQEIFSDLLDFIKSKKLSMDVLKWDNNDSRVRHEGQGHPVGMRPVVYKKGEDGMFSELKLSSEGEIQESPCESCGKTKFF
ncbi:hypothetical protein D1872_52010 [compost metagenome]